MAAKLTDAQRHYLDLICMRGHLVRGWGGYKSTVTVRALEARGLITLKRYGRAEWRATPTDAGQRVADRA